MSSNFVFRITLFTCSNPPTQENPCKKGSTTDDCRGCDAGIELGNNDYITDICGVPLAGRDKEVENCKSDNPSSDCRCSRASLAGGGYDSCRRRRLKETNGILEDILNTNETNVVPLFPGFSFFARYDTATCSNIQEVQSAMYYGFCNTREGGGSYGTLFLDFESCSSVLFTWPTSLNCTGPNFSEASDGRSLEGKVFAVQRYTEQINFATFACIDSKRSSCAPQHPPLRFPLSELDQSMGYFVQMNARNKEYTCEEAKAYINAVGPEAAFNTQGEYHNPSPIYLSPIL